MKIPARIFPKRTTTIVLFDLMILVIFILIPSGIVKGLEPCFGYGGKCHALRYSIFLTNSIPVADSVWYTFQTVTTIGFGDIIAGTDHCMRSNYDISHQTNAIFWVNKIMLHGRADIT